MQGVQGILKSGRTRLAAYENYVLDRCPECRADLVRTNEEDGGERACSRCGIVTGRANSAHRDGSSSAPSVSRSEPLGSYIIADSSGSGPSPSGHALGWTRLMPYIVDRPTPLVKCSRLTGRIAEKLALPKSIVQDAEIPARRLVPHREAYGTTIPSISAYSLLYACRSTGIAPHQPQGGPESVYRRRLQGQQIGAAAARTRIRDAAPAPYRGGLRESSHREAPVQRGVVARLRKANQSWQPTKP